MTVTRKLAAILAADVVGFSKLIGEDEAGRSREWSGLPRSTRPTPGKRYTYVLHTNDHTGC